MNCPYCGEAMILGLIHAEGGRPAFWLPYGSESGLRVLSSKSVEERGGVVIGEASKIGFFAKEKPMSFFCKKCRIILTSLNEMEP